MYLRVDFTLGTKLTVNCKKRIKKLRHLFHPYYDVNSYFGFEGVLICRNFNKDCCM